MPRIAVIAASKILGVKVGLRGAAMVYALHERMHGADRGSPKQQVPLGVLLGALRV